MTIVKYNGQRLQELMQQSGIQQVDIQRRLGYATNTTIKKWREGAPIYVDKLCEICNVFGFDIHSFFIHEEAAEQSGTDIRRENYAHPIDEKARTEADLMQQKIQELAEQQSNHRIKMPNEGHHEDGAFIRRLRDIFGSERAEREYWQEREDRNLMAQQEREERLHEKYMKMISDRENFARKQIEEMAREYHQEALNEADKWRDEIVKRETEINKWKNKYDELLMQYKELEMRSGQYGASMGVAEYKTAQSK